VQREVAKVDLTYNGTWWTSVLVLGQGRQKNWELQQLIWHITVPGGPVYWY